LGEDDESWQEKVEAKPGRINPFILMSHVSRHKIKSSIKSSSSTAVSPKVAVIKTSNQAKKGMMGGFQNFKKSKIKKSITKSKPSKPTHHDRDRTCYTTPPLPSPHEKETDLSEGEDSEGSEHN
jgi:hypothetical protein